MSCDSLFDPSSPSVTGSLEFLLHHGVGRREGSAYVEEGAEMSTNADGEGGGE